MTPEQAQQIKDLAQAYADKAFASGIAIGADEAPPDVVIINVHHRIARNALYAAIDAATERKPA